MRVSPLTPRFGAMIPVSKVHIPAELEAPENDWRSLLNGADTIVNLITNPDSPEQKEKAIEELRKVDPGFDPNKGIMVVHEPDWAMMYGEPPSVGKVYLLTGDDVDRAKKIMGDVLQREAVTQLGNQWKEIREKNGMDVLELDVSKAQTEAMYKLKRSPDTTVTSPIMPLFVDPYDDGNYQLVEIVEDDPDLWRRRVGELLELLHRKMGLQGLADGFRAMAEARAQRQNGGE